MSSTFDAIKTQNKKILLWLTLFTITLHSAGLIQFIIPAIQQGILPGSFNWSLAVLVNAVLILLEILIAFLSQTNFYTKIQIATQRTIQLLTRISWFNLLISLVVLIAFTYLVLNPAGQYIPRPFTRLFLFWLTIMIITVLVKAWSVKALPNTKFRWFHWLGIIAIFSTFGYYIFSNYPDISRYPYTLSWSETSRYYYASLFFSNKIYGFETPPTVLHPSRYLLQAIPFILPQSPLVLHRAWQVFLWIAITITSSYFIVKRSHIEKRGYFLGILVLVWSFIYLLVGPVYYHLQIPLILTLWGFNRSKSSSTTIRFLHNLFIIGIASAWAGISRVNWFPVPGLLAAALIFIEQPIQQTFSDKLKSETVSTKFLTWSSFLYGLKTVGWTAIGTLIAFFSQYLYILWSGNTSKEFTSSFSSDLLWYRLWPSSTYPLGILPGIIVTSLPLWLIIWSKLRNKDNENNSWTQVHPIRLLGLATILFVLFIGGLVVSVKIGGGSNLHNLDAYLSLLLIITVLIAFNRFIPDKPLGGLSTKHPQSDHAEENFARTNKTSILNFSEKIQTIGLVLCLIIPISQIVISKGPTTPMPPLKEINHGLAATSRAIESIKPEKKDVLFLTNRHWLTFGYIKDVDLIPEYERVYLMEMVMSNNEEYLERFHQDLANHRFKLIISEPIYITEKSQNVRFSEENNAWVTQVSEYIFRYYKPRTMIKAVNLQIFIPRIKKTE